MGSSLKLLLSRFSHGLGLVRRGRVCGPCRFFCASIKRFLGTSASGVVTQRWLQLEVVLRLYGSIHGNGSMLMQADRCQAPSCHCLAGCGSSAQEGCKRDSQFPFCPWRKLSMKLWCTTWRNSACRVDTTDSGKTWSVTPSQG